MAKKTPRQRFTDEAAKWIDEIYPGGGQGADLRAMLDALTESQFKAYVDACREGDECLPLTDPNMMQNKPGRLTIENNFRVAKDIGVEFLQHLYLTDPTTGQTYRTPEKYLVGTMFTRLQRQMVREKMSIPEGNKHVDELSGQVTGPSKGSKMSLPELQLLQAQDLDPAIVEFIKYRGGDTRGMQIMYKSLMDTGQASLNVLDKLGTQVKSNQVLSEILHAMMLSNTLTA